MANAVIKILTEANPQTILPYEEINYYHWNSYNLVKNKIEEFYKDSNLKNKLHAKQVGNHDNLIIEYLTYITCNKIHRIMRNEKPGSKDNLYYLSREFDLEALNKFIDHNLTKEDYKSIFEALSITTIVSDYYKETAQELLKIAELLRFQVQCIDNPDQHSPLIRRR